MRNALSGVVLFFPRSARVIHRIEKHACCQREKETPRDSLAISPNADNCFVNTSENSSLFAHEEIKPLKLYYHYNH